MVRWLVRWIEGRKVGRKEGGWMDRREEGRKEGLWMDG